MIPAINGCEKVTGENVYLSKEVSVRLDGLSDYCVQAFADRMERRGCRVAAEKGEEEGTIPVCIRKDESLGEEGYRLGIFDTRIQIDAGSERGAVWALTSLVQMIGPDKSIRKAQYEDAPRMAHRGLHLDVARHFFDADEVKKLIEQIALAKLNVLHWHLSDDQGWRIESRRFPKLQEVSGACYTQEEIRDIVSFAHVRGVEIIPEIDMPGHMSALLAAYPQYGCSKKKVRLAERGGVYRAILCAGNEAVYDFLEELLDELCGLFPSKRFHIGGDEVPKGGWQACPVCSAKMREEQMESFHDLEGYFLSRAAAILKRHGKSVICWNDCLVSRLRPENLQIQYWSVQYNGPFSDYINEGGSWIYSDMFELYLDYPHAMTSVKKMYDSSIDLGSAAYDGSCPPVGMEACVWTEHIADRETLERRTFPRAYVLAELTWSRAGDYREFEERLKAEMERAMADGVCVTPFEGWNPQGEARRRETLAYMGTMNAGITTEETDETVDPSDVGEDFQRKFVTRFFAPEDAAALLSGR